MDVEKTLLYKQDFDINKTEIKVLDKGFVRLVDSMGSDATAVRAARTSYSGLGTKSFREDKGLLEYLIKHKHWSPFEQVALTFHMKIPIFIARQIVRHRTAKLNEMSARYSKMEPDFWMPKASQVRGQSKTNKQGSEGFSGIDSCTYSKWEKSANGSYQLYQELLDQGITREQARTVLPVSLYTQWYWQMDLRNLIGFLKLRMDSHAQQETREVAKAIFEIASKVAPETMGIAFGQSYE